MFIHIGNDMSVRRSSVTAIINLETALPSRKDIADFMKLEDEQGKTPVCRGRDSEDSGNNRR